MTDRMSGQLTPEERAKLQRDSALNTAVDAKIDRDIAEAQAKAALDENMLLESEARAARQWGAQSAAEKTNAQRIAEGARSEARASTAGFFIVLTILIVVGVISLIVYANRTTTVVENPPIQRIINTAPAPVPAPASTTTIVSPAAPAPPANVTINQAPAPTRAEPPTTIIVQPPAIATGNGSSPRNQSTPSTDTSTNTGSSQTTTGGSSQ